MRGIFFCGVGILAMGAAFAQDAASPWRVTLTPPSTVRVGSCGAVQLSVQNAAGTDAPRTASGYRIGMDQFDMSVSGAQVAGHRIDAHHFAVCACQGARPGSVAKVKATYPASALDAAAVAPNARIEREATFTVAAAMGPANPAACMVPSLPPAPVPASQASRPTTAAAAPAVSQAPAAAPLPRPGPSPSQAPAAPPTPPQAPSEAPADSTSPADAASNASYMRPFEMPPIPPSASDLVMPTGAIDGGEDEDDPLAMFAALMPVLKSPRCVNCHSGTDPATDTNHGGGQVDVPVDDAGDMLGVGLGSNEGCVGCHDAPDAKFWKLAPKRFSLVGRETLQLCRQFRSNPGTMSLKTAAGRAAFLDHLINDHLIVNAFVGNRGIADESPQPPPMTHQRFIALARHWLEDGEGACANDWNGTITETVARAQESSFAPAPGGRTFKTDARIAITVVKNEASAQVQYQMRDFTDVPTRECATYNHQSWSALGNNLPVELTIVARNRAGQSAASTPAAPASGLPAGVKLPPGIELPPGFVMPDLGVPAPGQDFFRYTAVRTPVSGQQRSDIRSLPGCRQVVANTAYAYHVEGAMIPLSQRADPNHFKGEKITRLPDGTRTITWDLKRNRE